MTKAMIALVLCLFTPLTAFAADSASGDSTEREVAAVEAAVHALTKALESGNAEALQVVTAAQLTYGHSSGKMENRAEFIAKLASGASDFVSIKLLNPSVTLSGDVALVRHDLDAKINDNGKPGSVYLGVLLVWQKQAGQWLLIARQAFRYPQ